MHKLILASIVLFAGPVVLDKAAALPASGTVLSQSLATAETHLQQVHVRRRHGNHYSHRSYHRYRRYSDTYLYSYLYPYAYLPQPSYRSYDYYGPHHVYHHFSHHGHH